GEERALVYAPPNSRLSSACDTMRAADVLWRPDRALGSRGFVPNDADLLHGDQPPTHHRVDGGQHPVDVLLGIDDLDDEGQVGGQTEQARRVDERARPKARAALQYRRAR